MKKIPAFELNTELRITASGEQGIVIGRAEYSHRNDQYLLRYQNAEGRAVEEWWGEDALEEIEEARSEAN